MTNAGEMKHVHIGELEKEGLAVFAGLRFSTPWSVFDYWVLEPGQVRTVVGEGKACEQGYVLMGGPVEFTLKPSREGCGEQDELRGRSGCGPGFIVGPVGHDHSLENLALQEVGVLHVGVDLSAAEMAEARIDSSPRVGSFDVWALKWRTAIHGGCGQIATRHVLKPEDFSSTWTFLDHAVLDPGGSVGYHYHDGLEESFAVLDGEGLMTVDDETFAVGPGSMTWQGIGQGHGIYNPGPQNLEFIRIAVAQQNEEYTTIDLHDDLSSRGPT